MADDQAAARREARRQRILKNQQARLEKIAGKPLGVSSTTRTREYEFQNGQVHDTTNANDGAVPPVPSHTGDCSLPSNIERNIREATPVERFFKQIWEDESISDLDVSNFATRNSDLINAGPRNKYVAIASSLKLHFVLLALLTCVLFYLDLGYMFGETIFIPFFIAEISNLLVLKFSEQSTLHTSGMIGAVLILCGISPNIVNTLTEVTNAIFIIGADLSMYFVCFILFHCALEEAGYLYSHLESNLLYLNKTTLN